MKYKIGDKVKLKTWKRLVAEFGFVDEECYPGCIDTPNIYFSLEDEGWFSVECPSRILTIKRIVKEHGYYCYITENQLRIDDRWTDEMIECLVKDKRSISLKPKLDRFEIIDI